LAAAQTRRSIPQPRIARTAFEKRSHGPSFSDIYIFPDSELAPINVAVHAAEEIVFEVRDAESLREHDALTL
jgi:cyclopropane-fatty-acyl-phospholipid synthase